MHIMILKPKDGKDDNRVDFYAGNEGRMMDSIFKKHIKRESH